MKNSGLGKNANSVFAFFKRHRKKIYLLLVFGGVFLASTVTAGFKIYHLYSLPPIEDIKYIPPVSTKILDRNGKLLYEVYGEAKRTPVNLNDISPYLHQATVAAEDKNFYSHGALSYTAILRAAWQNYKTGSATQGGSTITQQVVKNLFLTRNKSFYRKFKEAVLAQHLERHLSKNEILELYLNIVPYGRNTYGAEAASQSYFGKPAKALDIAESAYLAALPQAPSFYSPSGANFADLKKRQEYILETMQQKGYINKQELTAAKNEKVEFTQAKTAMAAPYFVKWVEQSLEQKYGQKILEEQGLEVYTTLDIDLQTQAEQIVKDGIATNAKRYNAHNASLVAIDPKTGEILAMVGGEDYFGKSFPPGCKPGINCQYDPMVNAATSPRQPGSSFKPYTYVTAFSPEFGFAPASIVADISQNFSAPGIKPYIPRNFDGRNHGLLSMRKALAGSLNIAAVRVLSKIGVDNVINTAQNLGISTPLNQCGLALTLGACEVTLLDHTAAFGAFANGGKKAPTTAILKIVDKTGKVLFTKPQQEAKQAVDPQAVYELVSVLSDNNARSFIFGSHSPLYFPDRTVAAKTGTSQDFKDGWTVGFTPQIVAGVWVGNNDSSLMRNMADGVMVAAPIWHKFMAYALKNQPAVAFEKPAGIKEVYVSASSGKLAAPYTSDPVKEVFADYSVPKTYDTLKFLSSATSTATSTLGLLSLTPDNIVKPTQ